MSVCSFSVATNRVWKDKNGEKQQSTDYHNIVVFGKQAETIAQYMRKGSQIMIEGRIQTRSWEGKDGQKNYRTEIVAENTQFGNRPKGAPGEPNSRKEKEGKEDLDEAFPDEPQVGENGEIPF